MHLGDGKWLLCDSCVDSRTGEVATLAYLRNLGLDVAMCVEWVVATHAHDDHIAGLARIVAACPSATIVLPSSSSSEEFLALANLGERLAFYQTRWTVYEEYRQMFEVLERDQFRRLSWATAGLELPLGARLREESVRLEFLAPSAVAETRSKRALGRMLTLANRGDTGERIARRDPNSLSSALVVRAHGVTMLLGGDAVLGSAQWGWKHMVASFPYSDELDAHKVPHHGSPNAYHEAVWDTWSKADCVNVTTPYRPSSLPRPEDVARMASHGTRLWQTASSTAIAPARAIKRAAAEIRQVASGTAESGGRMGQVRIRWRGSTATVETFDPAFKVP